LLAVAGRAITRPAIGLEATWPNSSGWAHKVARSLKQPPVGQHDHQVAQHGGVRVLVNLSQWPVPATTHCQRG
jgi:hypothetical protein